LYVCSAITLMWYSACICMQHKTTRLRYYHQQVRKRGKKNTKGRRKQARDRNAETAKERLKKTKKRMSRESKVGDNSIVATCMCFVYISLHFSRCSSNLLLLEFNSIIIEVEYRCLSFTNITSWNNHTFT